MRTTILISAFYIGDVINPGMELEAPITVIYSVMLMVFIVADIIDLFKK